MRVLTVNAGSSSIKFAIVDAGSGSRLTESTVAWAPAETHPADEAHRALAAFASGLSPSMSPDAVVHRIVHGGEQFRAPVVVDEEVRQRLGMLVALAPLHIPQALAMIDAARKLFPAVPQVAAFDTAFHATLPLRAARYALPESLCAELGIRRFGFHGLSHAHVADAASGFLRRPASQLKIVSCHLGNGASVTAIEHGASTETSMGMTPLEGLVMGTRAGDLDPGAILAMLRSGRHSIRELETLLNSGAGLKGMTGTTDLEQIEARAAEGDESCRSALAIYGHRVRKYIGAYAATMGGVDAIAFTGGIGEHSAAMRSRCTQRLAFLGAFLDEERNRSARATRESPVVDISDATSEVRILVIAADEERVMARQAAAATTPASRERTTVPIAISARHAHLSVATLARLFGAGTPLHVREPLAQPGQFAAQETVTLVGPRGRIEHVRLIGPPRDEDQVELARSDEFVLGVDAPVRDSGDLGGTPGIVVEGPRGRAVLPAGVICARRHVHFHTQDASRLGIRDGALVAVRLGPAGDEVIYRSVRCRVSEHFTTQLHLDVDEANAARVAPGDRAELLPEESGAFHDNGPG